MEEVSAQAHVAADGVDSPLAVALSRHEVERTLDEGQEADLVLDVVRSNGQREEQRVLVALDTEVLRHLLSQDGEQVVVRIDPESLAKTFDEVEAHGLREVGATFAIAIAAVGGGAGIAGAAVDQGGGGAQGDPPIVQAGMPRAMPSDYAAQIVAEHQAAGNLGAAEQQMPRAMPSDYAVASGIESIRAAQPAPEAAPDPSTAIENVRAGGSAVPDGMTTIENVRAQVRAPEVTGAGGISVPAASVLVGGALLTIAAAMFAARRRVEPKPA